jgi:plasmid stabilization system protein ParE
LRTIGFERRALIAFRVGKDAVTIVCIPHGGRDFERILRAGTRS